MKKLLLTIAILTITTLSYSANSIAITGDGRGDDVPDLTAGLGLDVKLHEFKESKYLDSLNLEVRKDFIDLDRTAAFLVIKMDLTK